LSPTATGAIVFAFTLAGMLLGMWLRNRLPTHHLDSDTQSSVKEVSGLIATMTALILGLVTASAQDSFTKVGAAVEHTAADVVALDRLLARFGPETTEIRSTLRSAVDRRIKGIWVAAAFAGYALFAPRNSTMTGILIVSAFSVACAIFLILELGSPFEGRIAVSGDPLRFALSHLGQ
jgi:hypothetical protein